MSYTACILNEKSVQVDGTSYACVVAMALIYVSQHAKDENKMLEWENKLRELQAHNWGTGLIGSTFDEIAGVETSDYQELIKGLYWAERKLKSFGEEIPNSYLRQVLAQGDKIGYIQDFDYDPAPFILTIRKIVKLLAG